MNLIKNITLIVVIFCFSACESSKEKTSETFNVEFEKFELENELDVIFHIDRSDPVVAIALTVHVGSAKEKEKRTGFAHLFEHLLFLESENLGKGGLDKLSARIGGSGANGSTSNDRTNYFQTVPNDALEKMLWAEADKLGWFINTVTDPVLAKEKNVVKNEKRQVVDNLPYGHTGYVIDKNLYPKDHPYSWQVIGSLEDLQNANLADVKEFYNRWYVPNNTTLVVSGDFDIVQAKQWVHKYFDEIPKGPEIEPLPKQPGKINQTIRLYHEDNFARLPELTIAWPGVEIYHPDSYPLEVLTQYLSQGKKAPLYQVLVENEKLTSNVRMSNHSMELAGQLQLTVRAYMDKNLNEVFAAVHSGLAKFESEGIFESDLNRIKARQETRFYNGLSSVLGKGFQLAQYNIFSGNPGFINTDIQNKLAVTQEDVKRVFDKYIKNKDFVVTSFVPKGKLHLILDGSKKAEVSEEKIIQETEETFDASAKANYERTSSTFNRMVEPPYGKAPEITVPIVWEEELSNELKIYGIENNEVPLVQFNIVINGGQLQDDINKVGVANLTAQMLTKGTKNKTAKELEEAIQQLGASLSISASKEALQINGNMLVKNYNQVISLLEEILFEPRWDETELELLKQRTISQIRQQEANPNSISQNNFNMLVYSEENIRSKNILGTEESVNSISIEDLKSFYNNNLSPSVARMHVVGSIDQPSVIKSLQNIRTQWTNKEVIIPSPQTPEPLSKSVIYFYDIPGAKQSVLRFGNSSLTAVDEDFFPATVMNYKLGGGGFASQLTQQLREGKGYTYGIRSGFSGTKTSGIFSISTGVKTSITLEAAQLIKEIIENYPMSFSENDLETTKGFM
ncbi:MAG: insulinase family protein, partial [Mariniphaga sp.]|nr:insulinase family protein [Mariniphaga sp.]